MANPFVKAWKYLMALFSSKIDEHADPKVQIQQAIEEAQRTHQALTQQAAQVIGNQRQLEMRLNRQLADIEKLQVNVRQALTLASFSKTCCRPPTGIVPAAISLLPSVRNLPSWAPSHQYARVVPRLRQRSHGPGGPL